MKQIVAFDIETEISDPKGAIQACSPFLIGIKPFSVQRGVLVPGPYRFFEGHELPEAMRHLSKAPGPIVGYNLLGFDYVVLRDLVDVQDAIERTIDLWDFLRKKTAKRRGLKLDAVCRTLLGKGKIPFDEETPSDATGRIAAMWMANRRDEVLLYNERDCDLAAYLWVFLCNSKEVALGGRSFSITKEDSSLLGGTSRQTTYEAWLRRHFKRQTYRARVDQFVGIDRNPLDLAKEYDRFRCHNTDQTFFTRLVPHSDIPSGEDIAPRLCPSCGEYVWESPYTFKDFPHVQGRPVPPERLDELWCLLESHVDRIDLGDHFEVSGFAREHSGEVRLYDSLGIDESDFSRWVSGIRAPALQKYLPRWEDRVSYAHRRTLASLAKHAEKEGLY